MSAVALRARSAGLALGFAALLGAVCLSTIGAMVATDGNPAAVAAPIAVLALGWAVWRLPVRLTALLLVFAMLIADYKNEMPYSGLWQSPFHLLGQLLFVNLSTLTGIGALRFPLLDAGLVGLILMRNWRRAHGSTIDGPVPPAPRVVTRVLLVSLGAVAALNVLGTATGGNFNESLWQLRQLLIFPLAAFLFLGALQGSAGELKLVARLLVTAAVIKSLCGIYFIYAIVRPGGHTVEFTTSHTDTLLFVTVLAGYFSLFLEKPTRATLRQGVLWLPIVLLGLELNDRRLAYVSLGAACFTIFVIFPRTRLKRWFLRAAVVLAPIAVLYLAMGWNSSRSIFAAAQTVRTLVEGEHTEAGADYRDIENADVIWTWANHAVLPLGFGHKFAEPVKLPDISFIMPTYQYHPHNTILWMWAIGGPLGFTLMFAPWVVAIFLAVRAYHRLRAPLERAAAVTCVALIIAHLNQAFGDMGTRSYFGSVLGALALAVAAKLAVRSGAWPVPRVPARA